MQGSRCFNLRGPATVFELAVRETKAAPALYYWSLNNWITPQGLLPNR